MSWIVWRKSAQSWRLIFKMRKIRPRKLSLITIRRRGLIWRRVRTLLSQRVICRCILHLTRSRWCKLTTLTSLWCSRAWSRWSSTTGSAGRTQQLTSAVASSAAPLPRTSTRSTAPTPRFRSRASNCAGLRGPRGSCWRRQWWTRDCCRSRSSTTPAALTTWTTSAPGGSSSAAKRKH